MADMQLLFEKSVPGRRGCALPPLDVPETPGALPAGALRAAPPRLPELSELDVVRHYTALSRRAHGVDNGFYPLGSCTMKYNPRVNEELAALPGFAAVHPLQPEDTVQGCLQLMAGLSAALGEITAMDEVTLQPAAGAHGEWTAMAMIRAYHAARGDAARTVMLVPDTAHGTNPASAATAGFTVRSVKSAADGGVDLPALRAAVGPDTAGLMLTNPSTLGLFESHIVEIAAIVHDAGGLLYYDGANLNAILGITRPGDMGFDLVHLNLHKTFGTPHGGGGPGAGPVGCKAPLIPFLPGPRVVRVGDGYRFMDAGPGSIGRVKGFHGNFAVCVRAWAYLLSLGADGLRAAAEAAVLHANYLFHRLPEAFTRPYPGPCMHEFVVSAEQLKKQTGCSALDVAKALLDEGIHPPTVYFPLIVHEAMMFEPTETESLQTLDEALAALSAIVSRAYGDPEALHAAPVTTPVGRLDETEAARRMTVRYAFDGSAP